jgi:oligosaccharide repeat unit polymerase
MIGDFNMAILLFASLLLLLWLYILIVDYDLLNPGVIFLSTFLISSFIYIFYNDIWGIDLSLKAFIVIIIGAFTFCLGVFFTLLIFHSKKVKPNNLTISNNINTKERKKRSYILGNTKLFFVFCYLIVSGLIMFFQVYKVSVEAGNVEGITKMIEYARFGTTNLDLSLGRLTANLLRINYSLGIVLFYFFCKDLFKKKVNSYRIKILLLSIFALALSIFSTGRTQILGMIAAYLFLFILEYARVYAWKNKKYMKKVFDWLVRASLTFIILFTLSGVFALNRMGEATYGSIIDNIAQYIGSPIPSLSYFIENRESYGVPSYFGENTFITIYGTLKTLGVVNEVADVFLPPVVTSTLRTNVYTLYYRYIYDFGIISVPLIQIINGIIFGYLYGRIKYFNRENVYIKLLYAILMYPLIMMFFEEQLYALLNTHIIRFLMAVIIYKILMIKIRLR